MSGEHTGKMLGWWPPSELDEWVRGEAKRRGVPYSVILREAVEARKAAVEAAQPLYGGGRTNP
jgi:hypothetical protein